MAAFTEEERAVDDALGYPKAYARLCRAGAGGALGLPYAHGPPHAFLPYVLQPHEALRAKDLNETFPVLDPEAAPTANPRGFATLLWKQLDHLGNAGFDPALFRVDAYGNVLYLHADAASPLAWDVAHWFPCARGGRTVPSNLRIVQLQVSRKRHNKLEFLVPWWDLQLGISVNHFLSIFASKNADFRNRAFAFLFADGAGEELSAVQAVEGHAFPHHFSAMKNKVGLAPAAIVSARGSSDSSVLKSLDANRPVRSSYPLIGTTRLQRTPCISLLLNPYLSIAMARDSLRQREESKKKQAELTELEDEVTEMQQKTEEDRVAIQDLEAQLIKRRRRVEKCRRLADAQSNYKAVLEKMIRDAMHQSVVYKEQLRLNQAATSTLMARLEAQRAMCDSSETELRKKYQHKDDLERQVKPFIDQARKRYRVDDEIPEEEQYESVRYLPERRFRSSPLKQELRVFLEQDQRNSDAYVSLEEDEIGVESSAMGYVNNEPSKVINFPRRSITTEENNTCYVERGRASVREKLEQSAIRERHRSRGRERKETMASRAVGGGTPIRSRDNRGKAAMLESETEKSYASQTVSLPRASSVPPSPPYRASGTYGMPRYPIEQSLPLQKNHSLHPQRLGRSEVNENMNHSGKGNVDKWLHMLMEDQQEGNEVYHSSEEHGGSEEDASDEQQVQSRINDDDESCRNEITECSEEIVDACGGKTATHHGTPRYRNCRDGITECSEEIVDVGAETASHHGTPRCRNSFETSKEEKVEKKIWFPRSDSGRGFRSLPSSPSKILGMRRGVEKHKVAGGDDNRYGYEDSVSTSSNKFLSKCRQALKKAVHK
ncbi:uncharacterized protein LOC124664021 [Lolium rigidum]|uniref:uncharacterized protein LOC124664021 n=1 Tax=Lolium rigidum TaxID=89674 RepID=UPI001F5C1E65|nr:uncharacterized protein LOC124664021 [Lolium rigidum]